MKKFWLNIKKQMKQYVTLARRMNEITTLQNTLKAVFFAMLITFLIVLLPVLLVVNLFVFTHLMTFLSILLVVLILAWVVLYFQVYYLLLKHYHPKLEALNLKRVQIIETIIVFMILLLVSIVVLSFIF